MLTAVHLCSAAPIATLFPWVRNIDTTCCGKVMHLWNKGKQLGLQSIGVRGGGAETRELDENGTRKV